MMGLGPEAYVAIGATLFNYGVAQLGAWLHFEAYRDLYFRQVAELEHLQERGVFARELSVLGEPAQPVNLGWSYEDGRPQAQDEFASLTPERFGLVDEQGRVWRLDESVTALHVAHLAGRRDLSEVDGLFAIPRGAPFNSPYYLIASRLDSFARTVEPPGWFAAWLLLLLTPALFFASFWFFPDDRDARMGLMMVTSGLWLFVCLAQGIFELRFLQHRSKLATRHWSPELR